MSGPGYVLACQECKCIEMVPLNAEQPADVPQWPSCAKTQAGRDAKPGRDARSCSSGGLPCNADRRLLDAGRVDVAGLQGYESLLDELQLHS